MRISLSTLDCLNATKPISDPTTLGIDPGKTGAVALIHGRKLSVFDYDGPKNASKLISYIKKQYNPDFCIIEMQCVRRVQ